jgi:hypothetical protein
MRLCVSRIVAGITGGWSRADVLTSQLEAVVEESRTYGVRGEEGSLPGWGWEQKETDIYKVGRICDLLEDRFCLYQAGAR